MTMEKVQSHIQTARTIINGKSFEKRALAIFERVKAEIKEIQKNGNGTLTPQTMARKEHESRERGMIDLAKLMRETRQAIDSELDKAQLIASAIIAQPATKPPQALIDEFTQRFEQLKLELLVFGTRANADKMVDLIRSVDNPYFADFLKTRFGEYGPALRDQIGHISMQTLYEKIKKVAETDIKASAQAALQEIDLLRSATPSNVVVEIGIGTVLGSTSNSFIREYEAFLRQHGE